MINGSGDDSCGAAGAQLDQREAAKIGTYLGEP